MKGKGWGKNGGIHGAYKCTFISLISNGVNTESYIAAINRLVNSFIDRYEANSVITLVYSYAFVLIIS